MSTSVDSLHTEDTLESLENELNSHDNSEFLPMRELQPINEQQTGYSTSINDENITDEPDSAYSSDVASDVRMAFEDPIMTYDAVVDETTPFLLDYDANDPPPDYDDPGRLDFAELPSYQQVRREIDGDEEGGNCMSVMFVILILALILMTIIPVLIDG